MLPFHSLVASSPSFFKIQSSYSFILFCFSVASSRILENSMQISWVYWHSRKWNLVCSALPYIDRSVSSVYQHRLINLCAAYVLVFLIMFMLVWIIPIREREWRSKLKWPDCFTDLLARWESYLLLIVLVHSFQGGEPAVEKANELSQIAAIRKYGTYTNFRQILEWNLEESGRYTKSNTSRSTSTSYF